MNATEAVTEQARALTLIRVYEATVGLHADFANPLHNPGRVASYVLSYNLASAQLGNVAYDVNGSLARPAALDVPPQPRTIPARSPIGTALAFTFGVLLMVAGLVVALIGPPVFGASIAAAVLIATGGWIAIQVLHVAGRLS